ncbi:sugar transferase [Amylibacter kogurei]|uniref:Sugar transferase n=1 Tax=Paramylibacter kogurei TaxID=1889778 RepID=A0A2G5KDQ1_9RHOB|nr:sugar transferase [Amylibacter kogurei]PIB26734.1 sugar transferase [Amylibacter kogurei]
MSLHTDDFNTQMKRQHAVYIYTDTSLYEAFLKRLFDIAFIVLAAPIILTIVGISALLVWLDGGQPFYSQMRIGLNGKEFRMWKIRTMVRDADQVLEQYLSENPAARIEWDRDQKLKHDPRITKVGNFLRRSSIDEMPQFWNVLMGSMSVVGPRPMMTDQRSLYSGTEYFRFRPGLTGLWQVSDRNETTFAARVQFDNDYADCVSFTQDVSIISQTLSVVLRCTGR